MAVPYRIGLTFGSVPDRQIAVAESGEADHADGNHCLVCQYAAMDVERKRRTMTILTSLYIMNSK